MPKGATTTGCTMAFGPRFHRLPSSNNLCRVKLSSWTDEPGRNVATMSTSTVHCPSSSGFLVFDPIICILYGPECELSSGPACALLDRAA
ncbi:hypothetical protein CRG98_015719 [Punica granatum]|uniref:Uncharacterized protein n=1 Tax=Punica granatum TaxID=22663 RepID=A0A2I0K6Z1_PUNGR|nr:hypothetical protein CRG98_015719 [Punica granatum]